MLRRSDWTVWVLWIVVSAISAGLGPVLAAYLAHLLLPDANFAGRAAPTGDDLVPHLLVWLVCLLALVGPLIGVSQGLVLLSAVGYADWFPWTVASSVGIASALLAGLVGTAVVGPLGAVVLPGFVYGMVQWPVLRHSNVEVSLWITGSTVGWAIAAGLGALIVNSLLPASWRGLPFYPFQSVLYFALASATIMTIFSGIIGVVLFSPFRRQA